MNNEIKAIEWWNKLTFEQKFYRTIAWLKANDRKTTDRHPNELTIEEICEIYEL